MHILQISTADSGGGAEAVALNLHRAYRAAGHAAQLVVGRRTQTIEGVRRLANAPGARGWARWWWALDDGLGDRTSAARIALRRGLRFLADPGRLIDQRRGREPMRFPGAWRLTEGTPDQPDVVHAHNLHGNYFDLRALPSLSRAYPLVMTLHDAWLLSGHCAHSMNCARWRQGCGQCPDLKRYPAVARDNTAENWRRKQALYAQSRLYVVTPSRWLMALVSESMLAPALLDKRVIPYGIDLTTFRPDDRAAARQRLALPPDRPIMLFVAHRGRQNVYKDATTIQAAVSLLRQAESSVAPLLLVLGGETGQATYAGVPVHNLAFERDPRRVAAYYQAADIFLHAAQADTFPNTVLEALACGAPVVATAVGGVPEQIEPEVTGLLTPPGDAAAMAAAMLRLLGDADLRARLGAAAAQQARQRFDLNRQVRDYLDWYAAIKADFEARAAVASRG